MHLVWHRSELRTHDNAALCAAVERAKSDAKSEKSGVLALVIIDPKIFERADLTPRRKAWFLENTRALRESYRKLGSVLVVREGEPARVLDELAHEMERAETKIKSAHFIRNYTPYAKKRDAEARRVLEKYRIEVCDYGGQYTHEPGEVLTQNATRYSMHAPFLKRWRTLEKPEILPRPREIPPISSTHLSTRFLGEIPHVESDIELPKAGEENAMRRLKWFLENGEGDYDKVRQFPALENKTSKLSYYFNLGVLSPRLAQSKATTYKWRFELSWWDFFADILDNHPESAHLEAVEAWRNFPWRHDEREFERWKNGTTGFPLIDAGMRELNATGFMHNRVRMATADFLTRHLMIDWRRGEEYFRGQLLCGDRAQNVGNWQWVAGCGLSAKPYFRVGNPLSVAKSADADGEYIARWVPELAHLPAATIHQPWQAENAPSGNAPSGNAPSGSGQDEARAKYLAPLVDLKTTRARYLETAKAHLAKSKSAASSTQSA